ncbi:O-antigen ligase family protein [Enterobacter cloacae complex sp. 304I2]|uniref:O-antigen ligase family protein n=1 Tax=Enterobacter cloacae complex sp. 304I2 TaxID=3395829 RepID=UPI003CF3B335
MRGVKPHFYLYYCVLWAILQTYFRQKSTLYLLSIFGLIVLLSLPFIINNLSGYFINKMQSMEQFSNDSRYELYSQCIKIILDNPFGIGYGNYTNYITEPYPHNILLEIALNIV